MNTSYLSKDEYLEKIEEYNMEDYQIPEQYIDSYLKRASRNIDILTFNRITSKGFNNLSDYQQIIIKEVTFNLANFEYNDKDIVDSAFSKYSLNGVSYDTESSNKIKTINGILIKSEDYSLLSQSGLNCLSFYYY